MLQTNDSSQLMRFILLLLLSLELHAAPQLIAHRGASEAAPENTMAAFRLAWKEGADGIEGDFLLTKDKQVVCFHDKDTKRITGKKLQISQSTWATLKELDVGSWKGVQFKGERMPLLGDVLAELPENKFFFVEIKSGPEIVPFLKPIVAGADSKRVIFISFDARVVKLCREEMPDFQAHFLSTLEHIHKPGEVGKQLAQLMQINGTGLQFKHTAKVNHDFLATLRERNLLTACWTVNDPKTAARVAGLGIDFITTDRPAALRQETKWPD